LQNAFEALRKQGITALMNVASCESGCCVMDNQAASTQPPYIFFTDHLGFESGKQSVPKGGLFINHSLPTVEDKRLVISVLQEHGLNVEYDGSDFECIIIQPQKVVA
jgi:hypothetical protein